MADSPKDNKVVWDIESNDPGLSEKVRQALKTVHDPELGLTIIQLGLIRNVKLMGNQLIITMMLTTPYCPYGPTLLEQARTAVETATNLSTNIDLSLEPWDFTMMEDGAMPEWGLY